MMRIGLLFSLLFYAANAVTGVMPEKSRIVYHQQSKMQSSVLVNTNDYPVMVQLWIDDGELQKPPESATAPFVVTPAVFKINARQLNGIKVIYSGDKDQLPSDRESLFWLNILEVPPKPETKPGEEKVTLSMLTQIKILYRPQSINIGEREIVETLGQLKFTVEKSDAQTFTLTVNNPTPYVASFSTLQLQTTANASLATEPEIDLLVLPMSKRTFRFQTQQRQKNIVITAVNYALIDDSGRYISVSRPL